MVRDILALILQAGNEGRVEDGLRVRGELSVHLRMLGQLCGREGWSTRGSSLGDMGVDGVTMSRHCRRGVVGNWMYVDHGISGDHVVLLWGDVFRGSSFEVLGFLVHFEVVCRVIRRWGLECGWEGLGPTRLGEARRGWRRSRCFGGVGDGWCRVGDGKMSGRRGCRFGEWLVGDDVHRCVCVWACQLRSGARAQVGRSSSGTRAAGCRGWLIIYVIVDPVWRVRWERVTAEGGFVNVNALMRGVGRF